MPAVPCKPYKPVNVFYNGERLELERPRRKLILCPFFFEDCVWVPLRAVLENLGYLVK